MNKDEALKKAIAMIEFTGVRDSEEYWQMMEATKTACKEALGNLEKDYSFSRNLSDKDNTFADKLEVANCNLKQPAQEPVAWTDEYKMYLEWDKEALCDKAVCHEYEAIPLYPHPAPQPTQKHETWIDVNDKLPEPEINFLSFSKTYGYQVSMYSNNPFNSTLLPTFERLKIDKWMPIPVYTHPHQWQGLTDDEIQAIRIKTFDAVVTNYEAYRAIEQALKEKNHG